MDIVEDLARASTRGRAVVLDAGAPGRRSATALLGAAVVVGVVVPVALAVATGSLSIPHNDAWSYSRIAATFARTGEIELLGWNRSALFGQFLPLGPLARRLEVQQLFVAALALVALIATYDLVASSTGRRRAAFAVLVTAVWPGFGLLATTFMADVPTTAAVVVCLAVGRRALSHRSTWLLVVSIAFGTWGFTIREQALAAPVAVLLLAGAAAWRSKRARDWCVVACTSGAFLATLVLFELWRRSYPAEDPPVITEAPSVLGLGTVVAVRGYFLLALSVAPAVLLVARPRRWRRGALVTAAVVLLVAAVAVHDFGAQGFFMGNYLDPVGPYWVAGNGQPAPIFPVRLWWLVVALACASGVLMAGILVRRLPRANPLLCVFLSLVVLGNLASGMSGQGVYDRYWLLAVPPLLAVVLSERASSADSPRTRHLARTSAAVACAALAAVSLMITSAGLAHDSARWRAAERLVAEGVPATDVDAGLEWSGYHSADGVSPAGSGVLPGSRSCFTITAEPRADETAVRVTTYRTFVIAGTSRLWTYDDRAPECPPNTSW